MVEKTSRQWYDEYVRWGGLQVIYDPDGWDRRNWEHSWYKERISAEEFLRRANFSTLMPACFTEKSLQVRAKCGPMDDLNYFFTCVVREGDDSDPK